VHGCDRRIGERDAGEGGAQQHLLACLAVAAIVHRLADVGGEPPPRLKRKRVRHRVFLVADEQSMA